MNLAWPERPSRVRTVALACLALLGVAYLLYAGLKPSAPHADFNYYWLAGKLWGQGLDPYGPLFSIEGHKLGEVTFPAVYWAYTPNWWPISWLIARLQLGIATYIWMGLTLLAVVGSCELLRRARGALGMPATREHFLLLFCFVGLSTFASTTMMWGNVALFVMGGACLLAYALAVRSTPMIALALVIMLLKPHIGLCALVAVAVAREGWKAALWAVIASGLMAVPALLSTSIPGILHGLGQVDRLYEVYEVNSPLSQTGVAHFIALLRGPIIPGTVMAALGIASAAALSALGRRGLGDADTDRQGTAVVLFAGLGSAGMFLRLHGYDLAMLVPLVAIAGAGGTAVRLLVAVGAGLFFRPENLATLLGAASAPTILPGTLPSLGVAAVYAAAVLVCLNRQRGWAR